ncbi:restriction endonuclease subunit S [Aerococcaceae bacterium DSM 111022]|nr:restriction endonuclease subunit S [Aerococcaceae bacterium DSM 111022]
MADVQWGEYRLGDLFDVKSSKKIYHANQVIVYEEQINKSHPYVVRATTNNGVKGYIVAEEDNLNPESTLSFAQDTFTVFFQKEKYYTGNKVKILIPKISISDESIKFMSTLVQYAINKYGWGDGSTVESISNIKIFVPLFNEKIDFEFMESFVAELEAKHIAELEGYLKTSNLDNFILTVDELDSLKKFESIEWMKFTIGSLFSRVKTKKLPYKAKNLPTEANNEYNLPCLTSSFRNQGLNYYVPRNNATVLKNVISIPSNSDVYRAYFQSNEFTVLSDAYAIQWKDKENELTKYQYLFMVRAINKVTDLPIYSYKMKLGGWNVVKNKEIALPVKNGVIDFEFMETFVSAVSKLAIKDVVQYKDKRIEKAKTVIKRNQIFPN